MSHGTHLPKLSKWRAYRQYFLKPYGRSLLLMSASSLLYLSLCIFWPVLHYRNWYLVLLLPLALAVFSHFYFIPTLNKVGKWEKRPSTDTIFAQIFGIAFTLGGFLSLNFGLPLYLREQYPIPEITQAAQRPEFDRFVLDSVQLDTLAIVHHIQAQKQKNETGYGVNLRFLAPFATTTSGKRYWLLEKYSMDHNYHPGFPALKSSFYAFFQQKQAEFKASLRAMPLICERNYWFGNEELNTLLQKQQPNYVSEEHICFDRVEAQSADEGFWSRHFLLLLAPALIIAFPILILLDLLGMKGN